MRVVVVDGLGRQVARLADETGRRARRLRWRPDVAPGVYTVVVDLDDARETRRLTVVR